MVDGVLLLVDAAEGPAAPDPLRAVEGARRRTPGGRGPEQGRPGRRPARRGARRDLRAVPRPRRRGPRHRVPDHLGGRPRGPGDQPASACPAATPTSRRCSRRSSTRSRRPDGDPDAPLQALVTNLDASDYLGRLAHRARGARARSARATRSRCSTRRSTRARRRSRRRLAQPAGLRGRRPGGRGRAAAGDLFVVAGFPEVEIGDTLADPAEPEAAAAAERRRAGAAHDLRREHLADGRARPASSSRRASSGAARPRGARQRVDPGGGHRLARRHRGGRPRRAAARRAHRVDAPGGLRAPGEPARGDHSRRSTASATSRSSAAWSTCPTSTSARSPRRSRRARGGSPTCARRSGPHRRHVRGTRPRAHRVPRHAAHRDAGHRAAAHPPRGLDAVGRRAAAPAGWGDAGRPRRRRHRVRARQPAAARRAVRRARARRSTRAWSSARAPGRTTWSSTSVREKQKTNIRTHSHDEAIKLAPPSVHTLETAIEWIADDELVEVTPDAIRIRKRVLAEQDRRRRLPTTGSSGYRHRRVREVGRASGLAAGVDGAGLDVAHDQAVGLAADQLDDLVAQLHGRPGVLADERRRGRRCTTSGTRSRPRPSRGASTRAASR